jgi:hypothetical protein
MEPVSPEPAFGCSQCWPDSADAAWEARKKVLVRASELIDESHFHVMIVACPNCAQEFLSVFTETIDWVGGEDPQYWTTCPITAAQAADLVSRSDISERDLSLAGQGRRSLRHDFPKDELPRSYWGNGIWIGPHD